MLLNVALVLGTALVMLAGYFVMRRLDDYLASAHEDKRPAPRRHATALLFGAKEDMTALIIAFESAGVSAAAARGGVVPPDGAFEAAFALSQSDWANLLFIRRVRRSNPAAPIVARCNQPALTSMYRGARVKAVVGPGAGAAEALAAWKGVNLL